MNQIIEFFAVNPINEGEDRNDTWRVKYETSCLKVMVDDRTEFDELNEKNPDQ
jgi:hypothetical protein